MATSGWADPASIPYFRSVIRMITCYGLIFLSKYGKQAKENDIYYGPANKMKQI